MISYRTKVSGVKVIVPRLFRRENCFDLYNGKEAEVGAEMQEFGCEVQVPDPLAKLERAQYEYGITLNKSGQLPRHASVLSHVDYTDQPLAKLPAPLTPVAVSIDINSAYSPGAVSVVGACL